ncbi:MAG: metallophosphoesterase [Peptococcaceae bacterium]|nr:metallophosphoesterase [Peptococcaceae bacterium]
MNGKKALVCLLSVILCLNLLGVAAFAQEEPVAKGSIGFSFGDVSSILCGKDLTGNVYSYDIGGTDAFNLTFQYDTAAFTALEVTPGSGVTILATSSNDNLVSVVFMADPATADYANLLNVTVTAGADEVDGTVSIVAAEAAKLGGLVQLTIVGKGTLSIIDDSPINEFTIQTLSKAMTYYLYDTNSPNWAAASRYDMNNDGVIDLQDFIKIANAILDSQKNISLRFHQDGTFKIMMMSDFQDYVNSTTKTTVNAKSIALMNAALEAEKPDLVVMTGDMLGGNMNADQLQEYIRQMVAPMEDHQTPWMITYGNHDEDATTALSAGWNKIQQLAYYRSFKYNVNRASMSGAQDFEPNGRNTYAVGDMYQLIYNSDGTTPLYNVWAFDSNRYDVSGKGIGGYDWIRPDQISWYTKTSKMLEAKYGKLNSLMFYHIPTPEWGTMWAGKDKYGVIGERNEAECPANVNSGLFTAVLARGDVRGMFVGHDHVNDYVGNYFGVYLGYDANVGYQTYGLGGSQNDRMRGVRVFELNQSDLSKFDTRMVYAGALGVNQ